MYIIESHYYQAPKKLCPDQLYLAKYQEFLKDSGLRVQER
jgi:hypothetical protein